MPITIATCEMYSRSLVFLAFSRFSWPSTVFLFFFFIFFYFHIFSLLNEVLIAVLFIWFCIYFKSYGTPGLGNYEVRQCRVTVPALVLLACHMKQRRRYRIYVILPPETGCRAPSYGTSVFSGFPYSEKDIARNSSFFCLSNYSLISRIEKHQSYTGEIEDYS